MRARSRFAFPSLETLKKNDKERGNNWRPRISFLSSYQPWSSKYSWFPEISEQRSFFFFWYHWVIQHPLNQVPFCSNSPEFCFCCLQSKNPNWDRKIGNTIFFVKGSKIMWLALAQKRTLISASWVQNYIDQTRQCTQLDTLSFEGKDIFRPPGQRGIFIFL